MREEVLREGGRVERREVDVAQSGDLPAAAALHADNLARRRVPAVLIALSVRPGMSLTMTAHLVPCSATAFMISWSSSEEKPCKGKVGAGLGVSKGGVERGGEGRKGEKRRPRERGKKM